MASGLPVVATKVDGSPEAIQDGVNGFLLSPRDVDGMAERILQLLRDPSLCQRMGQEGSRRVNEFDIEKMMAQQEALYERMVDRKAQ
jgi:glycosyltransferase involved in cell wall biosynthesis